MREAAKDRISNLPDSLLHQILSFLEIKDVARTSVISKRWKYICITVPDLDFSISNRITSSSETDKFMDFVDGTLHRHKFSNVNKFSLRWDDHLNESRLHSWISSLLMGNVKELSLHIRQNQSVFIPPSLFTCESLISLDLSTYPNIRLPKCINFPRLKHLKLSGFEISDESWNGELFLNSPVLEELILGPCKFDIGNFCISIPTLLKVYILCDDEDCAFIVDAPRLVSFSYCGFVPTEFVLPSFLALEEANVAIYFGDYMGALEERLSGFLCSLAHYICITSYLSDNLPKFHNVKLLSISGSVSTNEGLIALLKVVPNLESLVIEQDMDDEIEEDSDEDDENGSDSAEEDGDDEDGSDSAEEDGDDEDENNNAEEDGDDEDENNNADYVEGESNHDNEDVGDVSDAADCGSADEGEDKYDNEDIGANSIEGENNYDNEDQGDVADSAECDNSDEGEANYNNEDDSLFPHLKSVCFQKFVGNPRELMWLKLILRDAKALQMMTICYYDLRYRFANWKSEKEVMVEIPSFPRASPGCIFKFSS
ncbi:F-box/LRR-repeat protein At4g14103-like isoform X2 [Papaver somniferum]|uniref:F-box/LRR-repeat protein At4g14103-like isoform X2 n=1 Tax=Papaver somniferum TaxID=3469 RepID=UPI000E6FA1F9|nr:F-box/LRR-repeat protein At4g14103-like isoform X2 [Papaver somniferum]